MNSMHCGMIEEQHLNHTSAATVRKTSISKILRFGVILGERPKRLKRKRQIVWGLSPNHAWPKVMASKNFLGGRDTLLGDAKQFN